jgi:hypothetical protein
LSNLLLLAVWALCTTAYAFPQNTRLGYANCRTCHVSPTGGGVLNPYGKSTASELSTWSTGIEPQDTKFIAGGDARYLWYKVETNGYEAEDRFPMQADFELGYDFGVFEFVAQYGTYYARPRDFEASHKHYMLLEGQEQSVRFGKFTPAFGLNTDDHTLPGSNSIGFSSRDVSLNIEYAFMGKRWNSYATWISGCQGPYRDDQRSTYCKDGKYGAAYQLGFSIRKYAFVSASIAGYMRTDGSSEIMQAVAWVLGGKHLYTMGEFVSHRVDESTGTESNIQGWIDLIAEYKGFDMGPTYRKYPEQNEIGIKARWLPLNGFELSVAYLKREETNKIVAIGHLYF